jgi:acetyltransferase
LNDAGGVQADTTAKVDALLNPRNVVILGATDRPGNWAQRVWRNLARYGFQGPVYPFNPGRASVWDTRCYRSFAELPERPDHLVVLIPAAVVPQALADGAAAGARSATVMTSGFGEAGDAASADLERRLRAVIADTGIAVSGPNCLGNLNAFACFMTMPDDRQQRLAPGPVAIIGQSGGLAMAIKRTLEERGVDTGAVITSGNESGLTTADYIAYFASQPEIKVIVSYLESVHHAPAFLDACRTARAAGKPVVVVKLGASDHGREAALAHTGRLAGSMEAFDAVAGPAGVIRVRNLDGVVEAVEYAVHAPMPRGAGLGAITFSGGLRGMLLDAASAHGLSFAPLSRATYKKLESLLSVGTIIGNPLDAGFAALTSQDAYLKCVEILLDDPRIDLLLLQEELPRGPGTEKKEANLAAVNEIAARAAKPIAFVTMISHGLTDYARALRAKLPHLAFLQEIDKSLATARAITDYAERVRETVPPSARFASTSPSRGGGKRTAELDKILSRAAAQRTLSEIDSKRLLKAYGIASPKEGLSRSEREAVSLANKIGFPVVAKIVSAELAHKSDIGGVMLGLKTAAEVRAAYKRLTGPVARRARVKPDGVLVAEQISDGLELVLGMNRDPEMGPVILFGAGGIELELARDVALAAPPLDKRAAEVLIARTRVSHLIQGYEAKRRTIKTRWSRRCSGSRSSWWMPVRASRPSTSIALLKRRGSVALDALVVLPGIHVRTMMMPDAWSEDLLWQAQRALELGRTLCSCNGYYHALWGTLRATGVMGSLKSEETLLASLVLPFIRDHARVMIAGSADPGVLCAVGRVYGPRSPNITIIDRCAAPLQLIREFAAAKQLTCRTLNADLLELDGRDVGPDRLALYA